MNTPFYHEIYDDFLPENDFNKIQDFYNTKKFDLKYTDLFKFLQTEELANDTSCYALKNNLDSVFKKHVSLDDTFYTIFASYYRKGDFLSCHDDMVDGRIYAFTFYLDDLSSGDLILFDNECTEEVKRISIKKNRLVIFEVSPISFHEVEICQHDGRKAITGWLNSKSHRLEFKDVPVSYSLPEVDFVPFEIDLSEDLLVYDGMQYDFESEDTKIEGRFVMRRVKSLILKNNLALYIPDYSLIYFGSYLINTESYILLNDFTNQYSGELLDIFIIESDKHQSGNIKLISEDGDLVHTLEILNNVMYVVKRKNMKYFIERSCDVNYKLVHMIYKLIN